MRQPWINKVFFFFFFCYIRNDSRPVQPEDRLCRACVDVFLNLS